MLLLFLLDEFFLEADDDDRDRFRLCDDDDRDRFRLCDDDDRDRFRLCDDDDDLDDGIVSILFIARGKKGKGLVFFKYNINRL